MAKLTLEARGRHTLSFEFESAPLASNYVTVSYFKNGNEFIGAFEETVEVGVTVRLDFTISSLDAGTEYLVYVFDAEENLLASATEATLGDKPIFKNHSVKASSGKINVSFSISGLNVEGENNTYVWGSNVWLYIDGKRVEKWDGDDIVEDDWTSEIRRGTLNVTKEYDFPDGDSCVVRIEAANLYTNFISGVDVYFEEAFREVTISLPFEWTIPKASGKRIRLGASEWNSFIERIKKRLQLKGMSYTKGFTTARSAGFIGRNVGTAADGLTLDSPKVISKKILCEAVDALNAMLSADERIAYPNGISAAFLNTIVDKLNSID